MSEHPLTTTARALRAMEALAADLATARREAAALRRENASLRAEIARLRADGAAAPALEAALSPAPPPARGG